MWVSLGVSEVGSEDSKMVSSTNERSRWSWFVTLALLFAGCEATVGNVYFVQPNFVEKAIFDPDSTWYYQQTVLDTDFASSGEYFEGYEIGFDKIRWRIEQDYLIGYRAYENVEGTGDNLEGADFVGSPVVTYQIQNHFDIFRGYNPSTGEQTNVIEENTRDRPWQERTYMRVDWTKNLAPKPSGLFGMIELEKLTPVAFYDQERDTKTPDRLRVYKDYIDIVGKYSLEPNVQYAIAYGLRDDDQDFPAVTVKIRHSFKRVKDDDNYEPLNFPDSISLTDNTGKPIYQRYDRATQSYVLCDEAMLQTAQGANCKEVREGLFNKFGYFRSQRLVNDPQAGVTESARKSLIHRWNLWKYSYEFEQNGNEPARDEKGRIKWKLDSKGNRIPIPYEQREMKPIVFYLSVNFPEYQKPMAQRMAKDWNEAFKQAVAFAQKKSKTNLKGDAFILKDNTCTKDSVKQFVAANRLEEVVREMIGNKEIVAGNLEIVCDALERATEGKPDGQRFEYQRLGDLRYSMINWVLRDQLSGPLGYGPSSSDPETGEIIHANANVYGAGLEKYAYQSKEMIDMLNGKLSRVQAAQGLDIKKHLANVLADSRRYKQMALTDSLKTKIKNRLATYAPTNLGAQASLGSITEAQSRLESVKGSNFEKTYLLTSDLLNLFGGKRFIKEKNKMKKKEINDLMIMASPSTWSRRSSKQTKWLNLQIRNNITPSALYADTIAGRAIRHRNDPPEKVFETLAQEIYWAVVVHEVGHTVGLRHNFTGSADALNYFDDYWRIHESTTNDEIRNNADNLMSEKQYSSIMDYLADFNSDLSGLGKYDYAAIMFGYAGAIEIFDLPKEEMTVLDPSPIPGKTPEIIDAMSELPNLIFTNNYQKIPKYFKNGIASLKKRRFVLHKDLLANKIAKLTKQSLPAGVASILPEAEVPYMFGSDEHQGFLFNNTFDFGASFSDIVEHKVYQYELYYPFSGFKRDRFDWDPSGYLNRLQSRYFGPMTAPLRFLVYFGNQLEGTELYDDMAIASAKALNMIGQILQTPIPDQYDLATDMNLVIPRRMCDDKTAANLLMNIDLGRGKPNRPEYTDDYYYKVTTAGSVWERIAALEAMTDAGGEIFKQTDASAAWEFANINFYRIFKEEVLDFMTAIILDDTRNLSAGALIDRPNNTMKFYWRPIVPLQGDEVDFNQMYPASENLYPVYSFPSKESLHYALLYGMAFMTSKYDQQLDFAKYLKIMLKGSSEDVGFDQTDPNMRVEFVEPASRQIYHAVQTTDGKSIGFALLKRAKLQGKRVELAKQALDPGEAGEKPFHLSTFFDYAMNVNGEPRKDTSGEELIAKRFLKLLGRDENNDPVYTLGKEGEADVIGPAWSIKLVNGSGQPVLEGGQPVFYLCLEHNAENINNLAARIPSFETELYATVGTLDTIREYNKIFEFGAVR